MSQKIVIPKGLIDPNETTIIEIPESVQNVDTVVAKPMYSKSKVEAVNKGGKHSVSYHKRDNPSQSYDHCPNRGHIRYIQEEIEEYSDDDLDRRLYHTRGSHRRPTVRQEYSAYRPPQSNLVYDNRHMEYGAGSGAYPRMPPPPQRVERDYQLEYNEPSYPERAPVSRNHKLSRRKSIYTSKHILPVLDAIDRMEINRIYKNLREYQTARRKLLYETASLHTFEDLSSTIASLTLDNNFTDLNR